MNQLHDCRCREGVCVAKWVIGLLFKKLDNVNVDLTSHMQSFCDSGKL